MKILKGILLVLFITFSLAACGGGSGGGDPTPASSSTPPPTADVTKPTVESVYPEAIADPAPNRSAAEIQTNGIKAIFDEAIESATVNATTFTVFDEFGTQVTGAVSYEVAVRTAKFVPDTALTAVWQYDVTLTNGIKDLAGNLLQSHTWRFEVANGGAPPPPPGP